MYLPIPRVIHGLNVVASLKNRSRENIFNYTSLQIKKMFLHLVPLYFSYEFWLSKLKNRIKIFFYQSIFKT